LILLFLSLQHGEIQQASGEYSTTRAAGIVGNANGFAYHLLFINYAALYFWRRRKALWWKVFLAVPMALSIIGIVFSGSRNGLFGIATFFILFGLIAYKKKLPRNPLKLILITPVLLAVAYFAIHFITSSTFVGKRMFLTHDNSSMMRLQLFLDGLNMILHNPVFGVGLNNYMAHSSIGLYSHSNYIEVAANTGIVGLFFYYSIYVLLWRRLGRIKKMVRDPNLIYQVGLFKAAMLTILLQSAQTVNIRSKITWIFLAGAIGYSWAKERQLLRRNSQQAEQLRMRSDRLHD